MATFEQRGQIVGTQYNADNITVYGQATPRPEANAAQEMVEPPPVDVVLITPLEEERDAVLAKLDGHRQLPPTADDIRVYYAAELPVTFPDGATATYRADRKFKRPFGATSPCGAWLRSKACWDIMSLRWQRTGTENLHAPG